MNRITYHKKNGEFGIEGVDITSLGNLLYAAVCKLKDYEDTGMSPGEMKRMIADRDKKPRTNYEHIKSMSIEEMAVSIMCPADIDCTFDKPESCEAGNCARCTLEWLKNEAKA